MPARYEALWKKALTHYREKGVQNDPYLPDKKLDSRRGLSLIARIPLTVQPAIKAFLSEFAELFPGQYAYPDSDLHLTIMTMIGCSAEFDWKVADWIRYAAPLEAALRGMPPIPFAWRGITASPACILLQGFPLDNGLENVRNAIRKTFAQLDLPHSMDRRYFLRTAHSTIVRFQRTAVPIPALIQFLEANRQREFGEGIILNLELVHTDWYMSQDKVQRLQIFPLGVKS